MSAFSLSICAVVDINRFDYMSYAVFVFIFLGLLGQFGHYYWVFIINALILHECFSSSQIQLKM